MPPAEPSIDLFSADKAESGYSWMSALLWCDTNSLSGLTLVTAFDESDSQETTVLRWRSAVSH